VLSLLLSPTSREHWTAVPKRDRCPGVVHLLSWIPPPTIPNSCFNKFLDNDHTLMVTCPMSIEINPLRSLTPPRSAKPCSALGSRLLVPAHSPLTPLDSTLTGNALNSANYRRVTLLESIPNFGNPFTIDSYEEDAELPQSAAHNPFRIKRQFAKSFRAHSYENASLSPLESTLTECGVLKSSRIILLQKKEGGTTVPDRLARSTRGICMGRGLFTPPAPSFEESLEERLPALAC
jgi:hypothetical protein